VAFANASIEKNDFQIPKAMVSFSGECLKKPRVCYFDKQHQQYQFIKDKILDAQRAQMPLCQIAVLCPQNSFLYGLEEMLTKHEIPNTLLDGKSEVKAKMKPGHVCLCTIHKSKGLEWDTVYLMMMNDEIFPSNKEYLNIAESRRLFYVGITRPRKQLYITYAPIFDCKYICRFVSEIDKNLYTFLNYHPHCIGHSESNLQVDPMALTKRIEKLDGLDYVNLKSRGILQDFS
jgi:superfamily I DNA/RNA helicase